MAIQLCEKINTNDPWDEMKNDKINMKVKKIVHSTGSDWMMVVHFFELPVLCLIIFICCATCHV